MLEEFIKSRPPCKIAVYVCEPYLRCEIVKTKLHDQYTIVRLYTTKLLNKCIITLENRNIWGIFEFSMSVQVLRFLFQVMYTCISEPCLLWFIEDRKSFNGIWSYSSLVCPCVSFRRHDYYNLFQNLHEKIKFKSMNGCYFSVICEETPVHAHNYIACTGTELTFLIR